MMTAPLHSWPDIQTLVRPTGEAEYHGEHLLVEAPGLGLPRAMLKLQPTGANELLGYRLAEVVGLTSPRAVGFWAPEEASIDGRPIPRGSVGVLLQHFAGWRDLDDEEAAELAPDVVGRALALCALDRHEWGTFGVADGRVYFVDLERLLPLSDLHCLTVYCEPERRAEVLAKAQWDYLREVESSSPAAGERATRLEVRPAFVDAVRRLAGLTPTDWLEILDLTPHPLASDVGRSFAGAAERAARIVARTAGIR